MSPRAFKGLQRGLARWGFLAAVWVTSVAVSFAGFRAAWPNESPPFWDALWVVHLTAGVALPRALFSAVLPSAVAHSLPVVLGYWACVGANGVQFLRARAPRTAALHGGLYAAIQLASAWKWQVWAWALMGV